MALTGSSNTEKIYNFLKSKGLNDFGACGLMGNLKAESALSPTNLQNSFEKKLGLTDEQYTSKVDNGTYNNFVKDSAGYGLAQWTYWSRKQNLLNYAKGKKKSIGDLEMQLEFLYKELSESYSSVLKVLKLATSVLQASNCVLMNFERPANQDSSVQKTRSSYGQEYYNSLVKKSNTDNKGGNKVNYSRQKVVDLVTSWEGKKESDGSYKSIIDLYNSKAPWPRTKMEYGWPWCACTWSALAKALGYTAIMPIEISCYYLIEAAKKMGCWVENDAYVPSPADAILYDWQDNGVGDNTGTPDHVGTVIYVNKSAGYMVVEEGNYSNSVKRRTISINGKYIRGFITPKYTSNSVSQPTQTSGKSVTTVAREVISGMWGNGDERVANLKAKGYDPVAVQNEVNRILNGSASKPSTSTSGGSNNSTSVIKKVTSTCSARYLDKSIAGTYVTTDDLYLRNDAGKNKKALCCIPKGTEVHCYGYYNKDSNNKWYYIQFTMNGTQYTGFSHSGYLKKK